MVYGTRAPRWGGAATCFSGSGSIVAGGMHRQLYLAGGEWVRWFRSLTRVLLGFEVWLGLAARGWLGSKGRFVVEAGHALECNDGVHGVNAVPRSAS
jgi:hypothetical protein